MIATNADIVRDLFAAYLEQDTATAERLLADDLTFTSPQDDHIDRATFFERCFPTADRLVGQELEHVVETGVCQVLLVYRYELKDGGAYRNVELQTLRDGKVRQVEVFFGGRIDTA